LIGFQQGFKTQREREREKVRFLMENGGDNVTGKRVKE